MSVENVLSHRRDEISEVASFAHAGPRRLLDQAILKLDEVGDVLARAQNAADYTDAFEESL